MFHYSGNGNVSEKSTSTAALSQSCCRFEFDEILLATDNFNESLVVGEGGFGKVYKGNIIIGTARIDVAIKRLDFMSNQGASEFWAEVEMLSKLRHAYLVSLIGYSNYENEMILVYEYMPHGTLEDHLHKSHIHLSWLERLKICLAAARGLDYLHNGIGIEVGVIHRDVKSSNILLHERWAAKISDFGLARIGPTNQPSTYVNTLVKGTFGYIDPNYFATGKLTRKSDVYAFGVVLFEVLCQKRPLDKTFEYGLATWVQDSIKEGNLKQIVYSGIRREISSKCLKGFARIAERCLDNHPNRRPTMTEVVFNLESLLAQSMSSLQQKTNNWLQTPGKKIFGRVFDVFSFRTPVENSGAAAKGNKILILSFEVANTIVKGANLMQSLSKDNIQHLKEVVLPSEGVEFLISRERDELLRIAAADKREELKIFSGEVIRFGNRCKDPQWHNLDRYFEELGPELVPQKQLKEEAETIMEQLKILVQYTAELYHEFHALDRLEQDFCRKQQEEENLNAPPRGDNLNILRADLESQRKHMRSLQKKSLCNNILEEELYHEFHALDWFEQDFYRKQQEEENLNAPPRGDSLNILRADLKSQRKHVRSLQKKSFWNKIFEEVMEHLVDIVHFLHMEIHNAFGTADTQIPVKSNRQKLGAAGLALHYANVITQIDTLVTRSSSVPPSTRDSLYQGLPPNVKLAMRSKLHSFQPKEELTIPEIKAEMEKTLQWLVPIATNTTKAHHRFGWVGEWANAGSEANRKPSCPVDSLRIETLHHADKEKTEECILELVVWLHHLVCQSKAIYGGMRSPVKSPIRSPNKTGIQFSSNKPNSPLPSLTSEDREMLRDVSKRKLTPGISKSQEFDTRDSLRKHHRLTKSSSHSPTREIKRDPFPIKRPSLVPVISFHIDRIKAMDVIDRVDDIRSV